MGQILHASARTTTAVRHPQARGIYTRRNRNRADLEAHIGEFIDHQYDHRLLYVLQEENIPKG